METLVYIRRSRQSSVEIQMATKNKGRKRNRGGRKKMQIYARRPFWEKEREKKKEERIENSY